MTSEEILGMSDTTQLLFTDGVAGPIRAERKPYYDQRFMAGRYHPNPFHPPLDRVKVKCWYGYRHMSVQQQPVPKEYAHYPQYHNGTWSIVR